MEIDEAVESSTEHQDQLWKVKQELEVEEHTVKLEEQDETLVDNPVEIKVEPDLVFSEEEHSPQGAEEPWEHCHRSDSLDEAVVSPEAGNRLWQCGELSNCSSPLPKCIHNHSGERCGTCCKTLAQGANLNQDLAHSDKQYKFDTYDKTLSQSNRSAQDTLIHTGEKPNQSDSYRNSFGSSGQLTQLFTPTAEKPFQCVICSKIFSRNIHLTQHLRTHTGEKPFHCHICEKTFALSGHLTAHLRSHTGEKPFQCDVCNKTFSQSSQLTVHHRSHTGERPYPCDNCNKNFSSRGDLNRHLRTQTGEKPYKCPTCPKTFRCSSHLVLHLRTHTGEKPHQCEFCNKTYSDKSALNHHLRTHTGDKPYKCDLCNKCFSQSGNLKQHLRTHTGNKPFECATCNKTFSNRGNLNRHIVSHCGEKP